MNNNSLDKIYKPIQKELEAVKEVFRKRVNSEDKFIAKLSHYTFLNPGKLLRPSLVLFSHRAVNGNNIKEAINLAASLEMFHTATLVHDDVIDKAALRRNKKTINFLWGDNTSILFGDYLFSNSFKIMSLTKTKEIFTYLAEVMANICNGEMRQLRCAFNRNVREKDYLQIIQNKTASLFEASCKIGASIARAEDASIKSLAEFGRNFGMAFQIIDDCLDIVGDEKDYQKTLGTDIKEGKATLPLIYLTSFLKDKQFNIFTKRTKSGILKIKDMLIDSGVAKKTVNRAREFMDKAKGSLLYLEDTIFKRNLFALSDFVIERVRL